MKRSRTMMGLVALLLAGAGAFASISQPQQPAYYMQIEGSPSTCTLFPEEVNCEPGARTCKKEVPDLDEQRQLYDDEDCTQPLAEESGF